MRGAMCQSMSEQVIRRSKPAHALMRNSFEEVGIMRFLLALIFLTPSISLAQEKAQSGKTVDCYCTDRTGARVELGQSICLQVDGRMFTAQCQMSLNVPMWRETQEGCLSSEVQASNPLLQSFPVNTGI
jgi:hypothetical protein